MRITVTLDNDVHKLLTQAARRSGRPFEKVLNDAVRAGLGAREAAQRFEQPTFSLGSPKVALTKASAFAGELEDQELAAKLGRR